jgi:hypothetical protein
MPFICLANANVPNGVLQITDLWPNVSQDNNPTNPPGQTRYLARPATDNPAIDTNLGTVVGSAADSALATFSGLSAYLVDKVEPGSLNQATGDITLTIIPNAGDQIMISGVADVVIEFSVGATDITTAGTAIDPFICQIQGTNALTAAELVANVINQAVAIAKMKALLGGTNYPDSGDVGAVVTLDALTGAAANLLGSDGDFGLSVPVGAARITVPTPPRLARANEAWTVANIAATAAALLNRVDTGLGMTLANIVTVLTANAGADLTGAAASSNSVGTLLEMLQVLAGRTYQLPLASAKFTAAVAPDTVHLWSAVLAGSFTTPNTTWDTGMLDGEWGATTAGTKFLKTGGGNSKPTFVAGSGDVVNNEIGGARQTFDGTHFQASVLSGQLSQFAAGVTLFPDPEVQHWVGDFHRRSGRQAPLLNQRVVTVYDDDGTLLV